MSADWIPLAKVLAVAVLLAVLAILTVLAYVSYWHAVDQMLNQVFTGGRR
jgi:hypothetical protein